MNTNTIRDNQLELGFHQPALRVVVRRKETARAQWWFAQMRRAVDAAAVWRPQPVGRPEQIQLIAGRQPSLA
jgi:hypothetical protein